MSDVGRRVTQVLLVEAEPTRRYGLDKAFRGVGSPVEIHWTGELAAALERLSVGGVDAVILDPDLPDSQGIASFERMYAFAPNVPIIVLTKDDDEELAVRTVQGGAQDCMRIGEAEPLVLVRSVRYAIERHRLLSALRSLSLIDDLTDLYNRRGFHDLGEQHLKLARRTSRGVALVYVDIDRFKTINDTLGHHVGDRALLRVADTLRATFRRSDIIARMGGDEFAVLALEASGEDAEQLVERLRAELDELNQTTHEEFQLSVSIGVARYLGDEITHLQDLLAEADRAMYEEKRTKRKTVGS